MVWLLPVTLVKLAKICSSLILKNNGISFMESGVPYLNMGAMTYNCFNRKNPQ